jgi:pimeloyl-[acyl-carrier protein] methyl ester esterase
MKLYAASQGQGPAMVLVHGLGSHSGIFAETVAALQVSFQVTCIDLPGHGRSEGDARIGELAGISDLVVAHAPPGAIWIGWSLGGLVALKATQRHPSRVARLIVVSGSPRFSAATDWVDGIKDDVWNAMGFDYGPGFPESLKHFFSFQVRGSRGASKALRGLLKAASEYPPKPDIFRAYARLLETADLRCQMREILCPVRFIMGEKDSFAPSALGLAAARLVADGFCEIIPGAGHVPFLSHPELFLSSLTRALEQ